MFGVHLFDSYLTFSFREELDQLISGSVFGILVVLF